MICLWICVHLDTLSRIVHIAPQITVEIKPCEKKIYISPRISNVPTTNLLSWTIVKHSSLRYRTQYYEGESVKTHTDCTGKSSLLASLSNHHHTPFTPSEDLYLTVHSLMSPVHDTVFLIHDMSEIDRYIHISKISTSFDIA